MRSLLERVPGYFIVYDRDDRQLYSSIGLRQLPDDDRAAIDQRRSGWCPTARSARVGQRLLFGGRLLLAARRIRRCCRTSRGRRRRPQLARRAEPEPAHRHAAHRLSGHLLVSIVAAYLIAGRAIEPVEMLINEVEAITDGRSLHASSSDLGNEELSRLGQTLNAMIARLETSFGALRRFTADRVTSSRRR